MQTLVTNPSEILQNGFKMEALGSPVALWGAPGTILTPRVAQRQKVKKALVRWPLLGLHLGALWAHFSAHGRLRAQLVSFLEGLFSRLVFSSISGTFQEAQSEE